MKTKVFYLKMIDGDPIVQWMSDDHIMQAVYDYDIHYLAPDDLKSMTKALCDSWVREVNSMDGIARMAGL